MFIASFIGRTSAARDLTFFIWSDTHFGAHEETDWTRLDIIEQINKLPGTQYPPGIFTNGTVDEPSFLMHLGDITHNGFMSEWDSPDLPDYVSYIQTIKHLSATDQTFEAVGNHDVFNGAVIPNLLTQKHGQTYYSFTRHNVHFVILNPYVFRGETNPILGQEQLNWLKNDLDNLKANTPVIIGLHIGPSIVFDSEGPPRGKKKKIKQLLDIVSEANVIAFFQGHRGTARVVKWNGFDVITSTGIASSPYDCMSCDHFVAVVRITNKQMTVLSYDWFEREFRQEPLFVKTLRRGNISINTKGNKR